jgi:hypothetical protein
VAKSDDNDDDGGDGNEKKKRYDTRGELRGNLILYYMISCGGGCRLVYRLMEKEEVRPSPDIKHRSLAR